ncbi:phage portal protein [Rhodopirellula baltica]
MFDSVRRKFGSLFSYDALNPKGKRRATSTRTVREDFHTRGHRHTALQENADELCRNLSLAGFFVRKHCDYVASFAFHGRNDDDSLNNQIERLMEEDSTPDRMDVSGRFGREKMFRIAEQRRVIGGDTFLTKLSDGRLQGLQADLIKDPVKVFPGEEWINGVLVSAAGRPLAYGVRSRRGYSDTFDDRRLPAKHVIPLGFYGKYASCQVRGVSPIVAALNPLRDVYEGVSLALQKSKVEQLFALSFFRDADESAGNVKEEGHGYSTDFGDGGLVLDLEPGDRAEFLTSSNPSHQFQSFTAATIQIAMTALDLPMSVFDASHTNFYGSKAAFQHYERSCEDKRADQIKMRNDWTLWKLRLWIREGRLVLPSGITISDVRFEWVPRGLPFWDPAKEMKGHLAAIRAGLTSPQRVCRATGTEFHDNIDETAKAQEYARSKGVHVDFDQVIEFDPDDDDDEPNSKNNKDADE